MYVRRVQLWGFPKGYVHSATKLHIKLDPMRQSIDRLIRTIDESDDKDITAKEHPGRLKRVFVDVANANSASMHRQEMMQATYVV